MEKVANSADVPSVPTMSLGEISAEQSSARASWIVQPSERHIQRLIYLAMVSDPDLWTDTYMEEWGESTRKRNEVIGVSGFMLYNNPYCFEVLEGFPEVIGPLFHSIRNDPRRRKCILVADMHCNERKYPDWQVRTVTTTEALQVMVPTLLGQIAQTFLSMWEYLPPSASDVVLQGKDPRLQPPESKELVLAFVQLVEFPAFLTHPVLKEHVADVIEWFMTVCTQNARRTGGQVAKYLNGIAMLYWPAAVAAAAFEGLCGIADDLAQGRVAHDTCSPLALLHMRAGLHCGPALLCNVGTSKADFTLLGDSINVAAYLALLAATLDAVILVSEAARARMGEAGQQLQDAGEQQIKGRTQVVRCFRSDAQRLDLNLLLEQIRRFGGGPGEPTRPRRPVVDYAQLSPDDRPPLFQDALHRSSTVSQGTPAVGCLAWLWGRVHREKTDSLITCMYISRATAPMTETSLAALQRAGHRHNRARHLTADLLYLEGLFVQTIEGPCCAVRALWERLQRDPRHTELIIAHLAPIDQRVCTSPMGLHDLARDPDCLSVLPEVLGQLVRSLQCLEAYVPYTVVQHIRAGRDPQRLPPVRVEVNMFAADIVCFTSLSEGCPLNEVWQICTTFIDMCTTTIREAGGQVIKLVGDCVTAYFPSEAGATAVSAAHNLIHICRMRRQYVHPLDCRSVMACAVAIDHGEVIMCPCQSEAFSKFIVTGEVSVRVMDVLPLTRHARAKVVLTQPVADLLHGAYSLKRVSSPPSAATLPCYAITGPGWDLEMVAVCRSIETYHRACEMVCSTPYQHLVPTSFSLEPDPLVTLLSHDHTR